MKYQNIIQESYRHFTMLHRILKLKRLFTKIPILGTTRAQQHGWVLILINLAVLDSNLKVRGINKLRVCDASAFPTQITGNLNATVIAFAEKAAEIILEGN